MALRILETRSTLAGETATPRLPGAPAKIRPYLSGLASLAYCFRADRYDCAKGCNISFFLIMIGFDSISSMALVATGEGGRSGPDRTNLKISIISRIGSGQGGSGIGAGAFPCLTRAQ